MAFVQVQSLQANIGSSSDVITLSQAATQNNLIVISTKGTGIISSITDNASTPNTYALAKSSVNTTPHDYQYYGVQVTGGATTITVNYSSGVGNRTFVNEFSGGKTTNVTVFDKSAENSGNGSSGSLSLSPTNSGELIVAFKAANTGGTITHTAGTNYTLAPDGTNGSISSAIEYRLSGTTSETAPITWNNSDLWTEVAGAYIPKIAVDVAGNSGDQAAASSYSGSASWNGDNRLLAIDVSMLGAGVTVTAMTYGGTNCTLVGVKSTVTSFGRVEQWIIKQSDASAPAAGANTLAVTLSGSLEFCVEWVSYTNVQQNSPTEAFNAAQATNVGSATDASVGVTSIADQCWIHAAVVANDTSITAGNTTRNNIAGTLGSGANEDNGAAKTPAGVVTMSYSGMGVTTTWAIAGYALRPIGSADATTTSTSSTSSSSSTSSTSSSSSTSSTSSSSSSSSTSSTSSSSSTSSTSSSTSSTSSSSSTSSTSSSSSTSSTSSSTSSTSSSSSTSSTSSSTSSTSSSTSSTSSSSSTSSTSSTSSSTSSTSSSSSTSSTSSSTSSTSSSSSTSSTSSSSSTSHTSSSSSSSSSTSITHSTTFSTSSTSSSSSSSSTSSSTSSTSSSSTSTIFFKPDVDIINRITEIDMKGEF